MLLFVILLGVLLQPGAYSDEDQCDSNLMLKFRVSTYKNSTGHRIIDSEVLSFDGGKYATYLNAELFDTGCGVIIVRVRSQSGNGTAKGPRGGGFRHFKGFGFYKVLDEDMTWPDGAEACRKEEANLWLVESKAEYETLYNWTGDGAWIGVRRNSISQPWKNVLGEPMGESAFFEWLYGRPTAKEDNDCLLLDSTFQNELGMNNDKCLSRKMVICERPESN